MRMESCGLEAVQFNGDEDQEIPVTNGHTDDPHMQFDKGQNVPIAVLTSRPNSHPFNERRCSLFHPAKIGRAVAKGKPTLDNAIFDCKVLSRNHATLWYEDGKFYLQDTRSSNGTFVNSQRLSVANEESKPQEVFSGDIVQFGVDVLENSRKVTHGCIVASLRLFYPDGSEAQPQVEDHCSSSPQGVNGSVSSHQLGNISTLNLYQLAQCLKDALDREATLRAKFNLLKDTLEQAQVKAQSSWKSLVEEDRLLARVESLQSKLESVILSAGNKQEEELITLLRNEMIKMHEEKETYELVAKDTLWRAAEQSLLTSAKLGDLEIAHKSAQEQLSRLQEDAMVKADEITRLAEKHDKTLKELEEIQEKFKDTENLLAKTEDDYKEDKFQLEEKITDLKMKEIDAENFQTSSEKLNTVLQNQVEELKQELDRLISENKEASDNLTESVNESMASSQIELDMKEQQIRAYKVKVDELETQLEEVRLSEQQLSRSQETIAELELKVANLTQQLESSNKLLAELNLKEEKIRQLTNQVDKLEKQLEASKVTSGFSDKFALVNGDIKELSAAIPLKKQILLDTSGDSIQLLSDTSSDSNHVSQYRVELDRQKELLADSRAANSKLEQVNSMRSQELTELLVQHQKKVRDHEQLEEKLRKFENALFFLVLFIVILIIF